MPIYMDRHDVSDQVTAENVAQLHQQDLKIQHRFNCRGLTYWFDDKRKTAFCLIEAPNINAIRMMHASAHGQVPHSVIEVDNAVVESFLGRIEDPKKSQNTRLNIINDPAFRTIMVIGINPVSFEGSAYKQFKLAINNHSKSIVKAVNKLKGSIVKMNLDYVLVSFDSVTNAVECAIEIQTMLNLTISNTYDSVLHLSIGLSAGVPVTKKEKIFEDALKMADRLCDVVKGQIVITSEVKDLYESENFNVSIDDKWVRVLTPTDEIFLNQLMDYVEREWSNTTLNVDRFSSDLGYSKSKLNRRMIPLTGRSPGAFIQEYRLNRALKLLNNQTLNVSEVAFETGFNSPSYFTKIFRERFGVLPTILARLSTTNTNY